jgi:hypothetical protein
MGFQTTGKLFKIFDAQQVTDRFRKREFVVELADNPRYPQTVMFQLTGDRCEQLDDFEVGQEVAVEFSLRGREWTSPKGDVKYFNSLDVWKVEPVGGGAAKDEPPLPTDDDVPPPTDDDLPF